MILKVARYTDKQSWWIFDDIRKISISEPMFHSGAPTIPDGMDAYIFDMETKCNCDVVDGEECTKCICTDCIGYYILICRLNSGEEYSIAFDTVAYLLNDNGKTIEKIVANYNN